MTVKDWQVFIIAVWGTSYLQSPDSFWFSFLKNLYKYKLDLSIWKKWRSFTPKREVLSPPEFTRTSLSSFTKARHRDDYYIALSLYLLSWVQIRRHSSIFMHIISTPTIFYKIAWTSHVRFNSVNSRPAIKPCLNLSKTKVSCVYKSSYEELSNKS